MARHCQLFLVLTSFWIVTQIAQFSSSSGSNTSSVPRKEFLFKILVIGELGAGKTSLIKRYVHQIFSDHYRATIGVDFALKVFQWNDEEGTVIRLQLWDIAGQGRTICSFYYYHFSSPLTLSIAIWGKLVLLKELTSLHKFDSPLSGKRRSKTANFYCRKIRKHDQSVLQRGRWCNSSLWRHKVCSIAKKTSKFLSKGS